MVHNLGTPDWCRDEACQIGTQMRQPRSGAPNWNPDEMSQISAQTMSSNLVLRWTTPDGVPQTCSQMGCPRMDPKYWGTQDWFPDGGAPDCIPDGGMPDWLPNKDALDCLKWGSQIGASVLAL